MSCRTRRVAAGLEDASAGLHSFDHGDAVGHGVGHGFFAVDIFAGGDCVEGYAAMEMVAGGDDDGVDVFAIEERAVVAGGGNVGAVGFFGGGEAG